MRTVARHCHTLQRPRPSLSDEIGAVHDALLALLPRLSANRGVPEPVLALLCDADETLSVARRWVAPAMTASPALCSREV